MMNEEREVCACSGHQSFSAGASRERSSRQDGSVEETPTERRRRKEKARLREREKTRVRSRAKVPGRGRGRPPKPATPQPAPPPLPAPPPPPPDPPPPPPPPPSTQPRSKKRRLWLGRPCQGTTRLGAACAVNSGHSFRDAAPLHRGSAFCAHHQPDKFTGAQCEGLTKAGARCRVFSNSCYQAAAPLLRGGVKLTLEFEPGSTRLRAKLVPGAIRRFCSLHAPQAFELVHCAGVTRGGQACKITSMAPFPDAAPLRAGERFCATHAYQARPFIRCAGMTRGGARCQATSWQDHAGARPLRAGQQYCAKHAVPAASAAQQCQPCDEADVEDVEEHVPEHDNRSAIWRADPVAPDQLDDDSPLIAARLCASCGADWDLRADPEDAGVRYCGRCWDQWEHEQWESESLSTY